MKFSRQVKKVFLAKKAEPALREPKNSYSPAMASHYPGHGRRIKVVIPLA
jgi:hypothetical protein